CCGCCCAALRTIKRHPQPGNLVNAAFRAMLDAELCTGCGVCITRCQMEALSLQDGRAALNPDRCIGCGLCVTTCPTKALTLMRRPKGEQPRVPRNAVTAYIATGQARGKLGPATLVGWLVRSVVDRLRARIGGPARRA
ncbi:MAG: 4Fe-4S dicluster domain-containing protein, partial [Chloroflexi bacterium]|nr:4Fe-4S dicluster domain-containing protein [Chloroflexota bacterium]